jgi:hypothetical protein
MFVVLIKTFGKEGKDTGEGYISRGGEGLQATPEFAKRFNTEQEANDAIEHIVKLVMDKATGWDDVNYFTHQIIPIRDFN